MDTLRHNTAASVGTEQVQPGQHRFAAIVEYSGAAFAGWQRQKHAVTVQEAVENALSAVADQPIEVVCAGRTDAGVHALYQTIHFDSPVKRPASAWVRGTNSHLPPSVRLSWAGKMEADFHARFKAQQRSYRYVIASRKVQPALLHEQVAWTHKALDADRMQAAGRALIGEHDFTSFRASGCQAKHALREVSRLEVWRCGDFLYLDIEANAFLHHMVRNIAGALLAVGAGERPEPWVGEVLKARDRRLAGVTAPPQGLYLVNVRYPAHYQLPPAGMPPVFA